MQSLSISVQQMHKGCMFVFKHLSRKKSTAKHRGHQLGLIQMLYNCRLQLPQIPQGVPVTHPGLGMGSPLSTWQTGHSCGWISVLTLGMGVTPPMLLQEPWQPLA